MDFIFDSTTMDGIFNQIYEINYWGHGSGDGSALQNTVEYNNTLRTFLDDHDDIQKVVDLGCGDWQSTFDIYNNLKTPVEYVGIDIVPSVINANREKFPEHTFHCQSLMDVDNLPNADLYVLKDVIQHWSNQDLIEFMDKLTANPHKFKYILLCNCCFQRDEMEDCETGKWRPLRSNMEPLRRYNPRHILHYSTKEICLITSSIL